MTVSSKTGKVTRLPASHEHDSDLLKQQVTEAKKQAILNGANNPTVATRTIVGNLASKVKWNYEYEKYQAFTFFYIVWDEKA